MTYELSISHRISTKDETVHESIACGDNPFELVREFAQGGWEDDCEGLLGTILMVHDESTQQAEAVGYYDPHQGVEHDDVWYPDLVVTWLRDAGKRQVRYRRPADDKYGFAHPPLTCPICRVPVAQGHTVVCLERNEPGKPPRQWVCESCADREAAAATFRFDPE